MRNLFQYFLQRVQNIFEVYLKDRHKRAFFQHISLQMLQKIPYIIKQTDGHSVRAAIYKSYLSQITLQRL